MWFNSFTFLWFFPAVLILYYAIRSWSARKIFLLIASYFFYACWNPPFVLLLIASSAWDYTVGRLLGVVTDRWTRTAVYSVVHSATLQRRRNLGQWLQLRRDGGEVLAFLNNEDATAKPDTRQTHGFYPMRKVISEEDLLHGGQRASVMTEYAQQRADMTPLFVALVRRFRARGCDVILLHMPTTPGTRRAEETGTSFRSDIVAFAHACGAPYVDGDALAGDAFLNDRFNFADNEHLNERGAIRFSEMLAEWLRARR